MCLKKTWFILMTSLFLLTVNRWLALAGPSIGTPAPSLVVADLDGRVFDLSKMKGRVVLVNYWATWCGPCKKEMPTLSSFYQHHHAEGLEMIGISVDRPQDFERMRRVSRSVSYPTAVATQISQDGFGPPEGFPLTYVIDADGVVRDKLIDVRDELLNNVVLPLMPH